MTAREMLDEFERLTMEERIQLVQDFWDQIAANPNMVPPLTDGQSIELRRRLDAHAADPDRTIPADEVFAKLQRRTGTAEA